MVVYRKRKRFPLKWLVAAVIFIIVLGLTFNDVSGASLPF